MQPIWLVLLLMLGLMSESTLVEPRDNKLSEVADKGQQRLSTNNTLELVDIPCKTVTAYLNGTFQRKDDPNNKFDAQFQIKLQVSVYGHIFLKIQHWNNKYLDSSEMLINIVTVGFELSQCHLDQPCRISHPATSTRFGVEIYTHNSEWFNIVVLDFPSFLNEFTLKQAYGQCTKYKETNNDLADPNLYEYCACCGDYNPDPAMRCPKSPWQGKSSF